MKKAIILDLREYNELLTNLETLDTKYDEKLNEIRKSNTLKDKYEEYYDLQETSKLINLLHPTNICTIVVTLSVDQLSPKIMLVK